MRHLIALSVMVSLCFAAAAQAPKEDEKEKQRQAKLKEEFDLLPRKQQDEITMIRTLVKDKGVAKLNGNEAMLFEKHYKFVINADVRKQLIEIAQKNGSDKFIKDLGWDKLSDAEMDALRLRVSRIDPASRNVLVDVAKKIKADGLGKLSDEEKEFYKKFRFAFPPPK